MSTLLRRPIPLAFGSAVAAGSLIDPILEIIYQYSQGHTTRMLHAVLVVVSIVAMWAAVLGWLISRRWHTPWLVASLVIAGAAALASVGLDGIRGLRNVQVIVYLVVGLAFVAVLGELGRWRTRRSAASAMVDHAMDEAPLRAQELGPDEPRER